MFDHNNGALTKIGYLPIIFGFGFVAVAGYVITIISNDAYAVDSQPLQPRYSSEMPRDKSLGRRAAEQGDAGAKMKLGNLSIENLFGVAGVNLGMTVPQIERRLGKFSLVEREKAAMKELTGGLLNLAPEGVDKSYIAVTTESPGLLNRPRVDRRTGVLRMAQPKFEKDGFKFWKLQFTRKELGPKLLSMEVSREFDTKPDWGLIQEKLVGKYGEPSHTDANPSGMSRRVKRLLLWGECENSSKYLNISQCKGEALLVSFEEGKMDFAGTYGAKVGMKFVDGKLEQENEAAIKEAKQAKEIKTASQVDDLKF